RARGRRIERMLAADTVVDAKFITRQQLVVAEVTSNGYEYKLVRLEEPRAETPVYYQYFFDNDRTQSFYAKPAAETTKPVTPAKTEPYTIFKGFGFEAIDPLVLGYSSQGLLAGL